MTHEFIICSNVFVRKAGKVLMLRRSLAKKWLPGYIHAIGGKLDDLENPLECAMRELKEEAGITAKNYRLEVMFTEIQPYRNEPHNWLVFYFSADYLSGKIRMKSDEGDLVWLSPGEIMKQKMHSSLRYVMKHILDKKVGPVFGTLHYDKNAGVIKNKSKLGFCKK